jgi:hypothetical protein
LQELLRHPFRRVDSLGRCFITTTGYLRRNVEKHSEDDAGILYAHPSKNREECGTLT